MKTMLAVLALLIASPALAGSPAPPQAVGVSFGVFYSSLEPYGEWIELEPDYYVWRPLRVAGGWRPYFYGGWEWTPDGWYWVSDEPWAWAVYHYGRWYYDDYYGWVWVPGYDWSPAWVEWRYSDDVIGWAPLGPYAVFRAGFGIHYYHSWVTPNSYWCFVGMPYMGRPHIHRHVYGVHYNRRYLGRTHSIGGLRYEGHRIFNHGPDREFIERHGGGRIREARLLDVRDRSDQRVVRRGDRNEIHVYRPRGGERGPGSESDRPARFRQAERKPELDLRSTDPVQRGGERQVRRQVDVREAPRGEAGSPGRVEPRGRSAVRPAPEVRPQEQQRLPRRVEPGVRREAQPRRDAGAGNPGQSSQQRMKGREPAARMQQEIRPRENRQPQRAFRAPEARREQAPRLFQRPNDRRADQRERPAQIEPRVRPQMNRGAGESIQRGESQRAQRPPAQGAQRREDRRGRGSR